jgi:type I restriction enzyme R subunit
MAPITAERNSLCRDRERTAVDHNDKVALDELEIFRKDVSTFLRQYDFLSQIVNYEDISLEKLSIYLRHLAPVITAEQLNHEIDLSTVDFDYIAQHEQGTTSGKLAGGVPLEPAKEAGTGTVHDPEMVALAEVIEKINDLFSGDHPDSSVRSVVTHVKDRLLESETLQQQAQNNSLPQFSASPDLARAARHSRMSGMTRCALIPAAHVSASWASRSAWSGSPAAITTRARTVVPTPTASRL